MKKGSKIFLILMMLMVICVSAVMLVACKPKSDEDLEDEKDQEYDSNGMRYADISEMIDVLVNGITRVAVPGAGSYNGYDFNVDFAGGYKYEKGTESVEFNLVFQMRLDTAFTADAAIKEVDNSRIKLSLTKSVNGTAPVEILGFYYNQTNNNRIYLSVADQKMYFPSLPIKDFIKFIDQRINPDKYNVSTVADIEIPGTIDTVLTMVVGMLAGNDGLRIKDDLSQARMSIDVNAFIDTLMGILTPLNNDGMEMEGIVLPPKFIDDILGGLSEGLTLDKLGTTLDIPVKVDMFFNFDTAGKFTGTNIDIDVQDFDFQIPDGGDGFLVNLPAAGCNLKLNISKLSMSSGEFEFSSVPKNAGEFKAMNPINFEAKANMNFMDAKGIKPDQKGELVIRGNLNPLAAYILADPNSTIAEKEAVLGRLGEFQMKFTSTLQGGTKAVLFNLALAQMDGSGDTVGKKETSLFLQVNIGNKIPLGMTFNIAQTVDVMSAIIAQLSAPGGVATMADATDKDWTDMLAGLITDGTVKSLLSQILSSDAANEQIDAILPIIEGILKDDLFVGIKANGNFGLNVNIGSILDKVEPLLAGIDLPFEFAALKKIIFDSVTFGYDMLDVEFTSIQYGMKDGTVTVGNGVIKNDLKTTLEPGTPIVTLDIDKQNHIKKTATLGQDYYKVGDTIKIMSTGSGSSSTVTKDYKVIAVKGYDKTKSGVQKVTIVVQTLSGMSGLSSILGGLGLDIGALLDKYPLGVNAIDVMVTVA